MARALRGPLLLAAALLLASWTQHASAVPAQASPVVQALEKGGYTSFIKLAEAAGISAPSPKAKLTIFAPTNAAIDTFLKAMGLTLKDMQGRPGLAAAVVGYHVLPNVKGKTADVKGRTPADPLVARTADGAHYLTFFMGGRGGGEVVVQDVQNNTANFVAPGVDAGDNAVIFGIDRVLLSGDVFLTLDDLLVRHPEFKAIRQIAARAGVLGEVRAMGRSSPHGTVTLLMPTEAAANAALPQLNALPPGQLADVIRYHVLPHVTLLPQGATPGKSYSTAFKGHSLQFKFTPVPLPPGGSKVYKRASNETALDVRVVSEDGVFSGAATPSVQPAKVTISNLFAHNYVVHGIDAVLRPKLPAAPAAKPATPAAKPAAGAKPAGRSLLQWRRGMGPSLTSAAMTNTQASIRAAASGDSDPASAADAGQFNARAASAKCWNCLADNGGGLWGPAAGGRRRLSQQA